MNMMRVIWKAIWMAAQFNARNRSMRETAIGLKWWAKKNSRSKFSKADIKSRWPVHRLYIGFIFRIARIDGTDVHYVSIDNLQDEILYL